MLVEDLPWHGTARTVDTASASISTTGVGDAVALENPETSPVLTLVHIPKTAGTSVWRLMERAGESHCNLYVNDTYFVYTPAALADLLADSAITSISSHHVRTFPPYLGGRRMLYFTILRDPVEQFISYITFIKKVYRQQSDPNLLSCVPPDPPNLSLKEFARWLLTQDRDGTPFRENYTVNFLARQTYVALTGSHDLCGYRAVRLLLAKSLLDQFVFVALTERMDESIEQLRKVCSHLGIELPEGRVGRENASSELRDDLSWVHPDDEVGALLFKSVEQDRQLYDWAAARFEEHYWLRRLEQLA
jgi:hypothetical protein